MMRNGSRWTAVMLSLLAVSTASAQIRITEYMYSGNDEEFIELTNVGATSIDMSGWSFSDNNATPGLVDLSGFGTVAPGQSVIITENDPTSFDTAWSLGGTVTILQNSSGEGLGRNDSIIIYDASDTEVDRLDYGDEDYPGTFRTQRVSAWVCSQGLGANDPFQWNESVVADSQGTTTSAQGDVGSPGSFTSIVCNASPTGGCCTLGACTDPVTQADCELGGGVYQGDNSSCGSISCPQPQDGDIRITEYMYSGNGAEFIEITNFDSVPIDLAGWSMDDNSETPGTVYLTGIGTLAPGASGIITDVDAATFEAAWGISGVGIVLNAFAGLGRGDEINIYNTAGTLKDQLTYGDQDFPGTIRTSDSAGWPCSDAVGTNDIYSWQLAFVGDSQGSYASTDGDVGSPGAYVGVACNNIPTGACCSVGICTDETATSCILGGRDFQGDATDCGTFTCPAPTGGAIRITEYMYSGNGGEYIEFTNLDTNPIDMTGWSYDDNSATPGTVDLSAFGIVMPNESVILTEDDAATFETDWGISGVDIIGLLSANLGRSDQINLFDSGGVLVDRLTYGDEDFPGTIRTKEFSGWPCDTAVGNDDITGWFLSFLSDPQSSFTSANGDVGNPGSFVLTGCEFCGNGIIDSGEACDGGACCNSDCTLVGSGTVCRAASDLCDIEETCDGVSGACPADELALQGTVCRASTDDCDAEEVCDGASAACPTDDVLSQGTVCRAANGACDVEEVCDGTSAACPSDAVVSQGTLCRAAAGDCDVEEVCDGTSAACPGDTLVAQGTVCRPSAGACDVEETCDGASASCPSDAVASQGTVCRAANGACDVEEVCDGTGVACPADAVAGAGTVCRASTSDCDPAEECDGASTSCPADATITTCNNGDGCCPAGCDASNDDDCMAVCGNSVVEPGEECDDGNVADGDGCSSGCRNEVSDIPTVSEWGLVILALLLGVSAKLYFGRQDPMFA